MVQGLETKLDPRWKRATEWALIRFTHPPPQGRLLAVGVVAGLVLMIGAVDFATGIHISLTVFYLIPVTVAVAWLGWQGGVVTVFCSVAVRQVGDLISARGEPLPF